MSTITSESVAHQNLRSILETVLGAGAVSRSEIARRTGLSTPTVTRHVGELADAGVLRLTVGSNSSKSGPGRPARDVALEPGFGRVLGVDLGEHTIRLAVANFAREVLASRQCPSAARRGREASLNRLTEAIRNLLAEASSGSDPAQGLHTVVIGIPGIVKVEEGKVVDAPNFPGWRDLPLAAELRDRLSLDADVRIENDVNLAAVGEAARGAGEVHEDFVFVSIRRGIGAGIFLDGRLRRGRAGMAGEIGFMATSPDFDYRTAEGLGHLETVAGEQALVDRARRRDPRRWSQPPAEDDAISLRDLCLAARSGDETALAVLEPAFRHYGVAVANIVGLLDPELVVVGGDVTVIGDLAVERIRETLQHLVPHAPAVRPSLLGEDAALQGALHQAHLDAIGLVPSFVRPL